MFREFSILLFVLFASALVAATGCSISTSLETISDSISSPFESISNSSSGESVAYREDVSDYTVAYVRSGGDLDAYRLGLTALANERGVSNWEEDAFTCGSIGLGLQRADFDEAELRTFASNLFGPDVFGPDAEKLRRVRAGYNLTPQRVE